MPKSRNFNIFWQIYGETSYVYMTVCVEMFNFKKKAITDDLPQTLDRAKLHVILISRN